MSNREHHTIYFIYKAVEQPLVFHGLQGFYIWVAGIGLLMNFLLFTLLYLLGLGLLICLIILVMTSTILIKLVSRYSRQYGLHGWMKRIASIRTPKCIQL